MLTTYSFFRFQKIIKRRDSLKTVEAKFYTNLIPSHLYLCDENVKSIITSRNVKAGLHARERAFFGHLLKKITYHWLSCGRQRIKWIPRMLGSDDELMRWKKRLVVSYNLLVRLVPILLVSVTILNSNTNQIVVLLTNKLHEAPNDETTNLFSQCRNRDLILLLPVFYQYIVFFLSLKRKHNINYLCASGA